MMELSRHNRCAGIPSGPLALWTSRVLSRLRTPLASIRMGLMSDFGCSCIMGRASDVTGVNTEEKYSLSTLALAELSLIILLAINL